MPFCHDFGIVKAKARAVSSLLCCSTVSASLSAVCDRCRCARSCQQRKHHAGLRRCRSIRRSCSCAAIAIVWRRHACRFQGVDSILDIFDCRVDRFLADFFIAKQQLALRDRLIQCQYGCTAVTAQIEAVRIRDDLFQCAHIRLCMLPWLRRPSPASLLP